jgi:fructose-1,6-bisphosphatase/inositol monophosphatase family enzyme
MPTPSPLELLAIAERLARSAGALVHRGRAGGVGEVATKSSDTDVVTAFDRAAEALIVGALRAERPNDGIVGEEGTAQPGTSGVEWFIDPIDGTTNFLYALPGYAVSIAARDAAGLAAAAVAVPTFGEVFTAARGHGAFLDGRPLRPSATADPATALVATGFSYQAATREQQAAAVARLIGEVRDIRRFGAAAVDLCSVAAGRVDAYFEAGLNPWDLAAGELIAREAGAVVTDFAGRPPHPGQVLASTPGLHAAMVDLLARAGAA